MQHLDLSETAGEPPRNGVGVVGHVHDDVALYLSLSGIHLLSREL